MMPYITRIYLTDLVRTFTIGVTYRWVRSLPPGSPAKPEDDIPPSESGRRKKPVPPTGFFPFWPSSCDCHRSATRPDGRGAFGAVASTAWRGRQRSSISIARCCRVRVVELTARSPLSFVPRRSDSLVSTSRRPNTYRTAGFGRGRDRRPRAGNHPPWRSLLRCRTRRPTRCSRALPYEWCARGTNGFCGVPKRSGPAAPGCLRCGTCSIHRRCVCVSASQSGHGGYRPNVSTRCFSGGSMT